MTTAAHNDAMPQKKYWLLAAMALLGMALSLYAGVLPTPALPASAIANATVESSLDKKRINITLPYHRGGEEDEILDFTFQLNYGINQSGLFQVIPDDCIEKMEINGKPVELTGEALADRCNWQHGFKIDLKRYLNSGVNRVHIVIRNRGGITGLTFTSQPS